MFNIFIVGNYEKMDFPILGSMLSVTSILFSSLSMMMSPPSQTSAGPCCWLKKVGLFPVIGYCLRALLAAGPFR